jgi:hypothetical protein
VTTATISDWKELASREHDGLVISLFWSRSTDRVSVAVADQKLGEDFRLDVPGACALDAFHHPFAYASGRGRCAGDAFRRSPDVRPPSLVAERSADL